jgi:hypothetical protein
VVWFRKVDFVLDNFIMETILFWYLLNKMDK